MPQTAYLTCEIHIVRAGISLGGLVCTVNVLHHGGVDNEIDRPDPSRPLRRHHAQYKSRNTTPPAANIFRSSRHDPSHI